MLRRILSHILTYVFGFTAAIGLTFGFVECRLSWSAKPEPQTIRCVDMIEKGVGNNGHIILTDFTLMDKYVIRNEAPDKKSWKMAIIPVVPKGDQQAANPKKSFRVVLNTTQVTNPDQFAALQMQETVQGTIVTGMKSLDRDTRSLLQEDYPDADVNTLIILDHGLSPSPPLAWGTSLFVGALSLPVFLWFVIRYFQRRFGR